tara:strand:- start:62 stop:259 length:198 start_codon:yes stop_codon:yes gene_type:complete
MGTSKFLWVEANRHDIIWKASDRRNDIEGCWIAHCYGIPEMLDGNENAWSPLARHQRLAEIEYEV